MPSNVRPPGTLVVTVSASWHVQQYSKVDDLTVRRGLPLPAAATAAVIVDLSTFIAGREKVVSVKNMHGPAPRQRTT